VKGCFDRNGNRTFLRAADAQVVVSEVAHSTFASFHLLQRNFVHGLLLCSHRRLTKAGSERAKAV